MKDFILFCAVLGLATLAIASPAAADYQCFYGNLHAHTSYSDGIRTPDSAYLYARDTAHIDIQALTEHNNGLGYSMSAAQYQNLHLVADTMTAPGRFVALAGMEIGSEGKAGFGHICVWEAPALSPYYNTAGELQNCYQWITNQGAPAQYNHPGAKDDNIFNHFHYYPEYDQTMDFVEMFNSDYAFEKYFFQALDNGWRLGLTANQDNHYHDWGNRVNNTGRIPLTGIWADTLTKPAVLEALLARRTCAALSKPGDRLQVSLTADGHWMGEKYQRGKGSVDIVINARSQLFKFNRLNLYSDGQIIDSMLTSQTIVSWTVSKDVGVGSHYFAVKAMEDSGVAWSSPVYIDVPTMDMNQKVVTWPTPVVDGARISFLVVPDATTIKVSIYNLAGTRIWQATRTDPKAAILWDGRDQRGNLAANGIYYILVEQTNASQTTISKGKTMVSR